MTKHIRVTDSYFKDCLGVRVHDVMVLRDGYLIGSGSNYEAKEIALAEAVAEARAWIVGRRTAA